MSISLEIAALYFASDNCAGVHPKISDRLSSHAAGFAKSYGDSDVDRMIEDKFAEIFECDVSVFFVATGTASNSLALAAASKPGGVALCHVEAHVIEDECGAPEFFTNAGRLAPVHGKFGKIDPLALKKEFARFVPGNVHHGRPFATTITQSTEIGTVYSLEEISTISQMSHLNNVPLHMDGARFANGLVSLGVSPAEMTWRCGVDYLSFGATKNGCWCAEALICFAKEKAEEIAFLRKRAGQLISKSRFIAAQFEAYFADDLWLQLAQHSNDMARQLAAGLGNTDKVKLAWKVEANEVFVVMEKTKASELRSKGAVFYEWLSPRDHMGLTSDNEDLYRLVCSFATSPEEISEFISHL